jgi:hypothetical protein
MKQSANYPATECWKDKYGESRPPTYKRVVAIKRYLSVAKNNKECHLEARR